MTDTTKPAQRPVSPGRAIAWATALTLTTTAAVIVDRYALGDNDWGSNSVLAVVATTLFTRTVHQKLIDMWSKP